MFVHGTHTASACGEHGPRYCPVEHDEVLQGRHTCPPLFENVPAPQLAQESDDDADCEVEYVPARQLEQVADDVACCVVEYVPA